MKSQTCNAYALHWYSLTGQSRIRGIPRRSSKKYKILAARGNGILWISAETHEGEEYAEPTAAAQE